MLSLEVVISETDEEVSEFNVGGFVDLLRKIDGRESQEEYEKWEMRVNETINRKI